ncbi:alpha/beta fold hydrolase [Massilia sp. H6]|uniref:alpha/beta fold hydrolase n=1 Tax=Massilia sp. H6 TaxID=2970464 RepID=UPI002169D018|nr:alpha/beta hydrolase [Massilia sp. H6]UVW27628.1 alpha/beta hydrolase [Massilia sp. H6]
MKHLPKSKIIAVGGQVLRFSLSGEGSPTIVMLGGSNAPLEGWHKLFPELEKLGAVVAYDRPGVGASARPREPQLCTTVILALRALLRQIGAKAPYLLVAHGFGGLHANLFARIYPEETCGVLFLEASAPEDVLHLGEHRSRLQRLTASLLDRVSPLDPNDEISNQAETVAEIAEAPPFPDIPVTVISGGKPLPRWIMSATALRERERNQEALARLSPQGERVIAKGSAHFPQMSEPRVVLRELEKLLARTRVQAPVR